MKFFKDKKLEVDVYTSEIKMIENHIASILGRLNKLEELSIKPEPQTDLILLLRVEITLMQRYLEEQKLIGHFVNWRMKNDI
jgi:hypothetical protein